MTLPAEVMSQMSHRMTTTTFTLEGFRVVETKGVVRGIMVRSRNINLMLEHARKAGANAVIGVRYDATEVMNGVTEVLCYGTAVVVEPEQ